MIKNLPANAGDVGSIPGSEEENDNPLNSILGKYWEILLGNLMDRGASWATVHGVIKSQT